MHCSNAAFFVLLATLAWGLLCSGPAITRQARGEEPYRQFLQKLREQGLFDLALVYVADLEARRDMDREFTSVVDLERGLLLYQSAASMPVTSALRATKLDQAETQLREFLDKQRNHPRRAEARLKLGELLLTRAEESRRVVGETDEAVPAAIEFYSAAHELFESTIAELAGLLENLRGNRIDPADQAKVAIREQIQQDLRQAQLFSAKAIEERGRSQAEESIEQKKDLQTALQMFSDLYTKERSMAGIRNYALFYRSGLHKTLGNFDDAIDGYQRITDGEAVAVLRPLQASATLELAKLLAQQEKFPLAVERAEAWLAKLQPNERESAETMALKLALAEIRIDWANKLSKENPNDRVAGRQTREARSDLRNLLRVPGPHLEPARELLSQLGVEPTERDTSELPKVETFGEAFAAAEERLRRSDTDSIELEALSNKLADPELSAADKQQTQATLQQQKAAIDVDQQQAIELLRQAFALFSNEDDRALLTDARLHYSYLHLKQQQPWDAVVSAEIVARRNPGNPKGLRAAAIALGGYSDLFRSADDATQNQLSSSLLEPFATYLGQTWPASNEAAAAIATVVNRALVTGEFDRAKEMLNLVSADNEIGAKLRRDVGMSVFVDYLKAKRAARTDAAASEKLPVLRRESISLLEQALAFTTRENITIADIETVNALARLLLDDGQTNAAAELMLSGSIAPLDKLESSPEFAPARVSMESYRLAMQILGQGLAGGNVEADAAATSIRGYIQSLQKIAGSTDDGQAMLSRILPEVARDLEDVLAETNNPADRTRLADLFVLVAVETAKGAPFSTRQWAAQTILSIADDRSRDRSSQGKAKADYAAAEELLEAILSKESSEPGWIDPPAMATQTRLLLARARRGAGNYSGAIAILGDILKENANLLDVQMEGARVLQAWGTEKPVFYRTAFEGQLTGRKLFWGWGKISQMTMGKEAFDEQFFEARYQLAYCRYKYAMAENDQKQLARVEKDIAQTATFYPNLGGPKWKQKFDALLREVKKNLN